ncbi:MAG: DUF1364 family protein [Candidatus Hydrogenedentes bacterium]|nr:DUF1364 family protein [Candidatus Hydrogenedentota bacterium]
MRYGRGYRSAKLRNAAEGRPCVLCDSYGTTVAAHSNALEHGRGFGLKTPDYYVAYVCQSCHDQIDGRAGKLSKEEKRDMWMRAWVKTVAIWFNEGIVK